MKLAAHSVTTSALARATRLVVLAGLLGCKTSGSEALPTLTAEELGCEPVGEDVVEGGGLILTPEDLLPFCGARTIRANLIFGSDAQTTGWEDLHTLDALEVLEGGLYVQVIEESLTLPRLREAGDLTFHGPGTAPPAGLPRLETVARLTLDGYDGSWSLPALREVGDLEIEAIDGIEELSALESLDRVRLVDSPVRSLPAAPGLTSIGSVELTRTALISAALFANVTEIRGSLELIQNDSIVDLQPFASLTSIGAELTAQDSGFSEHGLVIVNNDNLRSLDGLGALRTLQGGILLLDNPSIETLDGLDGLTSWRATAADARTIMELGYHENAADWTALEWLLTAELPVPCDVLAFADTGTGLTDAQMTQVFQRCQP